MFPASPKAKQNCNFSMSATTHCETLSKKPPVLPSGHHQKFKIYHARNTNQTHICKFVSFTFTKGRGLTFIFAHVLVRPLVGGPGSQPTDTVDHAVWSVLSRPLWLCDHRMCVIAKETGQSPLARTCTRTSRRSASFCVKPFTSPKPRSKKMTIISLNIVVIC